MILISFLIVNGVEASSHLRGGLFQRQKISLTSRLRISHPAQCRKPRLASRGQPKLIDGGLAHVSIERIAKDLSLDPLPAVEQQNVLPQLRQRVRKHLYTALSNATDLVTSKTKIIEIDELHGLPEAVSVIADALETSYLTHLVDATENATWIRNRLSEIYADDPVLRRTSGFYMRTVESRLVSLVHRGGTWQPSSRDSLRADAVQAAEKFWSAAKDPVRKRISLIIESAAKEYVRDLKKGKDVITNGRKGLVEDIPLLFAMYLDGKPLVDNSTQLALQLYTSGAWGSPLSKIKAWSGVAGFILFGVALVLGYPLAPAILPFSALAIGLSLVLAWVENKNLYRFDGIVRHPFPRVRISRRVKMALGLALIPVVMCLIVFHGHELAASGRRIKHVIPFIGWSTRQVLLFTIGQSMSTYTQLKAHFNGGINPLKSSVFYIALIDNYFGGLNVAYFVGSESRTYVQPSALTVLRKIYNSQALSLSVNQFIKNLNFVLKGQRVDTRYAKFSIMWSFTGGITAKLILNQMLNLVDTTVGAVSKLGATLVSIPLSVTENYIIQSLKAAACLRFISKRMSFFGALGSLRIADLKLRPSKLPKKEPKAPEGEEIIRLKGRKLAPLPAL
ncbi:hypothetical protein AAMO2058_000177500 [Amorphochlora amoebiformis]